MLVEQKIGNLNNQPNKKNVDWLVLQWYETSKRILHKKTNSGKAITMKFMGTDQNLTQGDILFEDATTIIAIDIEACEAIVIKPNSMFQMASVCYEIGNKHLPLFYHGNELLVAYDAPLFRLLTAAGYELHKDQRKLLQPLKTSVAPHGQGSTSLFSKIMNLTTTEK